MHKYKTTDRSEMYKYTSQKKNEKDSKAENKVNNRDKSDFSSAILFVKKLNFRM